MDQVNITLKFTILEVVERRITRVKLDVVEETKKKKPDENVKDESAENEK